MIKAIIFDFDGTIYEGDVWGNQNEYTGMIFKSVVPSKEKYDYIMKKYRIKDRDITTFECIEIAKKEGLDIAKIKNIMKDQIYEHATKEIKVVDVDFLREISKKYNVYVVSLSNQYYLAHYMKKYGIDQSCFKKIYSIDIFEDNFSKKPILAKIIQDESCQPDEILMIGDDFEWDIKPAQQLGMSTLHFKGDYNQIYNYFTKKNLLNSEKYKK